jgi:primosomal protein N' (replication factor Y)
VNLRKAQSSKALNGSFSKELLEAIDQALKLNEQVILFQNRRGYAPILKCDLCEWKAECVNCDVSLTYHKHIDQMKCHYCSYTMPLPDSCPACGNEHIRVGGIGTQKIEDELMQLYPEAKIRRMDFDTASTKSSHAEILDAFEHREIDILVGTQMVTKGLDFDHISLVGVIEADRMIHFPDFRSYERAYQILTQVSGRAGRKEKQGKVIIQTYDPMHPIIQDIIRQDYEMYYKREITERSNFFYPPYSRLIQITLKHRKISTIEEASNLFALELKKKLGKRVVGPSIPPVSRIRNLYLRQILVKLELNIKTIHQAKVVVSQLKGKFKQLDGFKSVRIVIDVDPN